MSKLQPQWQQERKNISQEITKLYPKAIRYGYGNSDYYEFVDLLRQNAENPQIEQAWLFLRGIEPTQISTEKDPHHATNLVRYLMYRMARSQGDAERQQGIWRNAPDNFLQHPAVIVLLAKDKPEEASNLLNNWRPDTFPESLPRFIPHDELQAWHQPQ